MFDEKYKSLFHKIQVSEKHKELTKENMQKELNKMITKQGKNNSTYGSKYKYIAIAATILFASVVVLKFMGNERGDGVLIPPSAVETPGQGETTVLYSELNFADSIKIDAPVALNEMQGKIAPFTENLLGESSAVIKGTVTKISFKEYQENGETQPTRQSVVYEVKVDKIYYSNVSMTEGDTIIIENDLYTYTSLASSVEQLSTNRQYILSLNDNEEELSIIYPFAPQIEITEDGKYVFPDHWTTLINDKTKTVSMDGEDGFKYYSEIKLREDADFEIDFQKLVDTYCK